jgi:hypothetical protein
MYFQKKKQAESFPDVGDIPKGPDHSVHISTHKIQSVPIYQSNEKSATPKKSRPHKL